MTENITLAGFEAKFAGDPDPWGTFVRGEERRKRQAILRALGPFRHGRVLEVGAGNGSNSAALSCHALRLTITEPTPSGRALVEQAVAGQDRVKVFACALPRVPGRSRYDAIVIAEVLYYLPAPIFQRSAQQLSLRLKSSGRLVLAHHHCRFSDARRSGAGIHHDFLRATGRAFSPLAHRRTRRWSVDAFSMR